MLLRLDITGHTYGRLRVIKSVPRRGPGNWWKCQCTCGNVIYRNTSRLRAGRTRSCGCLNSELSSARRKIKNPVKTFWSRVEKRGSNECWPWKNAKASGKHGGFIRRGAHVFAFEIKNGPVPKGHYVCHSCDYPPCCNPKHLFVGTPTDNMLDASSKRRLYFQKHPELLPRGEKHGRAKLTDKKVKLIRQLHAAGAFTQRDLIKRFKVSSANMNRIVHNKTWVHVQ